MTTSGTNPAIARTPTVAAPSLSTLVNFAGGNGSNPIAGLIADTAGDLFGTTQEGGAANNGTVFEIVNTATGYASALNSLCSFDGSNGSYPDANLIADAAGDLVGLTCEGGAANDGTVFEIVNTATGYASALNTIVNFDGSSGTNPDAGLIADAAGDLFGTTRWGGAEDEGTVFEIVNTATGYAAAPTTLVSFNTSDGMVHSAPWLLTPPAISSERPVGVARQTTERCSRSPTPRPAMSQP